MILSLTVVELGNGTKSGFYIRFLEGEARSKEWIWVRAAGHSAQSLGKICHSKAPHL